METFHFFLKHTPFWAIPVILIGGEFAYIYWLRDRRKAAQVFLALCVICFGFLVYYYISGGPKGSVMSFIEFWGTGSDYKDSLMKP